ncbi:MAG: Type 1 glutamine amidotransferase-like domain-containing protein [Solirubrobacterales bacterium]
MHDKQPQIVAFGGGGFSMEEGNPLLDDYVLSLAGVERPKVCFLATASGDADHYIVRFYRAFGSDRCRPSHISFFRRERGVRNVTEHLLDQDVIYVGGGSVVSMLGVWRAWGVDETLREAWRRGVVLCGLSAGSLCWFESGVTAYYGPPEPVEGLGMLPYSNAVHYGDPPSTRTVYHDLVADGMATGFGVEDGAALHFVDGRLEACVSSRPDSRVWRTRRLLGRRVVEEPVDVRHLGADAPAAAARSRLWRVSGAPAGASRPVSAPGA